MKIFGVCFIIAVFIVTGGIYYTTATAQKTPLAKPVAVETCYGCHGPIKTLHAGSKHGKLNCAECHSGLDAHLKETAKKPGTNLALANCGRCHKEQY